jgi:hypothetical protein
MSHYVLLLRSESVNAAIICQLIKCLENVARLKYLRTVINRKQNMGNATELYYTKELNISNKILAQKNKNNGKNKLGQTYIRKF